MTDKTPQAITLVEDQDATKKDRELSKLIPLILAGNRNACKADPDLPGMCCNLWPSDCHS